MHYFWLIDGQLSDWVWGCHNMMTANVMELSDRFQKQKKSITHQKYNVIAESDGKISQIFKGAYQKSYELEIEIIASHLHKILPPVVSKLSKHDWIGKYCTGVSKITGKQAEGTVIQVYDGEVIIIITSPTTIDCLWGRIDFSPACCELFNY